MNSGTRKEWESLTLSNGLTVTFRDTGNLKMVGSAMVARGHDTISLPQNEDFPKAFACLGGTRLRDRALKLLAPLAGATDRLAWCLAIRPGLPGQQSSASILLTCRGVDLGDAGRNVTGWHYHPGVSRRSPGLWRLKVTQPYSHWHVRNFKTNANHHKPTENKFTTTPFSTLDAIEIRQAYARWQAFQVRNQATENQLLRQLAQRMSAQATATALFTTCVLCDGAMMKPCLASERVCKACRSRPLHHCQPIGNSTPEVAEDYPEDFYMRKMGCGRSRPIKFTPQVVRHKNSVL